MTFEQLRDTERRFHMPVYGRQPVAFVRGRGAVLWDVDGKEYLDFLSGIAVMSVGHSHPAVIEAVTAQIAELTHVSNLFYTEPQIKLAERLHALLGWGRSFFANSGAEANECALKLARKWSTVAHGTPRSGVVAALGSFHGRTFSTLAATGQPAKHGPFMPLPPWFTHVPFNDLDALEQAVDDTTSVVLLEVVQGEGGVQLATPEYMTAARKACDEHGALLVVDEVQTGLGRTGRWFAFEHTGVVPDIVTIAKALGGGLPIGACIAREEIADAFAPGDHATTFGGGPVVCAAAIAVLDVIEREGLVERAAEMGERLKAALRDALPAGMVREIRGLGLLIAVQLNEPHAAEVVARALEAGLVINAVAPDALRFAPPLIVDEQQVDRAAAIVGEILGRDR